MLAQQTTKPIGKQIHHPLQYEFDRSLYRVLGSPEQWRVGDKIGMIEFNNIRNKGFVRNKLTSLNFIVSRDVNTYVYIGSQGQKQLLEPTEIKEPFVLDPNAYYGVVEIRNILKKYKSFTTRGIGGKSKKRITVTVSALKNRDGMPIVSKEVKSGTTREMIYALA